MAHTTSFKYYKTKEKHFNYRGVLYFAVSSDLNKITKVIYKPGYKKKGRPNCIGIYLVQNSTFLYDYQNHLVEETTKQDFIKHFNEIQQILNSHSAITELPINITL